MKTWIDRLREMSTELLAQMIERQKAKIEMQQRDLKRMETVLAERCVEEG